MAAEPPPRVVPPPAPPPPEYRAMRDYQSTDTSMRNMALAAVGIAAVVMGGVFVLSRHHAAAPGVPVIEPDATPMRVKPADPGGMKIAGAEDALPEDANGVEADKLAPPPETPAPQVLEEQAKAGREAQPPRITAPVRPLPAAPAPVVQPAPPAPLPPAIVAEKPPPAPVRGGGGAVQLGALESQAAAEAEWARLVRKVPALAGRRPEISRTERDGKVFYRLRVAGLADIAAATELCGRLHAAGAACTLAWR